MVRALSPLCAVGALVHALHSSHSAQAAPSNAAIGSSPLNTEADRIRAWVERGASEAGLGAPSLLEAVKVRPWATVLRAATPSGDVYFKANAAGGRHEPAVMRELAQTWPDLVPAPLAIDLERGWMLTRDHGVRMSDAFDEAEERSAWLELLPRYAEIQIASAREPERWLALGAPDRRLTRMPALAERLVQETPDLGRAERTEMLALLPTLEARCEALLLHPFASALEHGDLHGANVLVEGTHAWLFDWADSNVSHPFCSLLVNLSMGVGDFASHAVRAASVDLVDAYLAPFGAFASVEELRPWVSPALWIAHVGRALDFAHMLSGSPGALREEWEPHIALWLRLWLERSSWKAPGAWLAS